MKKRILSVLILLFLIIPSLGYSQITQFNINDTKEQPRWMMAKLSWMVGVGTASDFIKRGMPLNDDQKGCVMTPQMLAKSLGDLPKKDKLTEFLTQNTYFSESDIIYPKSDSFSAVEVMAFKEKKALTICGVLTQEVLNTLKLDEYQRASRMMRQVLLPYARKLYESMGTNPYKYYIIGVCYASKNFLDDSFMNRETEMLVFVLNSKTVALFVNGEITDQTLVNRSIVFLSSKSVDPFRRTEIRLQN